MIRRYGRPASIAKQSTGNWLYKTQIQIRDRNDVIRSIKYSNVVVNPRDFGVITLIQHRREGRMDTIAALADVLRRDYPGVVLVARTDGLDAQVPVRVPALDGPLRVTADRAALDAMLRDESEALSRWWPGRPAEQALAELLSVHLAETIATLRPGELLVRLGEDYDRPPPADEGTVDGASAYAPGSDSRFDPQSRGSSPDPEG